MTMITLNRAVSLLLALLATRITLAYESVRALDEYGHAKQLQHAQAAADTQARLVVVVKHDAAYTIISVLPTLYHLRTTPSLVRVVTNDNSVAALGTGIQADVSEWIEQLQRASIVNFWDVYNRPPCIKSLAEVSAHIMRSFWGYDDKAMLLPSMIKVKNNDNDDDNDDDSWARPRGMRGMLLSPAGWYVVEPHGIIKNIDLQRDCSNVYCIGRDCRIIQEAVEKASSEQKVSTALVARVMRDQLDLSDSTTLMIEDFSSAGVTSHTMSVSEAVAADER